MIHVTLHIKRFIYINSYQFVSYIPLIYITFFTSPSTHPSSFLLKRAILLRIVQVPAAQRYALIGTVLGLVNKDLSLIINNLKTLKFFPPETDSAIVIRALDSALRNSTEGGAVSTLNFTRLNQNIESISYLLPLQLPPFYTLIVRTLTILEGLALYVDPSFRLIRGAYPFIAKQILTSPSPELTALLQDIIVTPSGNIRWDKLEQFISISSNADRALEGNFAALKVAQDRSDILKTYTGSQTKSNFTLEVSLQVIKNYIVSQQHT